MLKETTSKNESSGIIRGILWMAWSGIASTASGILLWIFLARLRDVEEVGQFSIVMGLYTLFYTVATMGLGAYITSEVSRRTDPATAARFIGDASGFLLIAGIATAALMTAAGFIVSGSPEVRTATAVLSLATVPTALLTVAESASVALGRARLIAVSSTVENILRIAVPIVLLKLGFGIDALAASIVAVRFVAMAVYLPAAREFSLVPTFERVPLLKLLRVTPTFAVTVILAALNWQAALILLGRFATAAESAKFGVASRFLIPVTILMASYASVIQPSISRSKPDTAGWFISKMAGYPLVIALAAAALSPFLSPTVLTFLFGPQYSDVAPTLDVLALSVAPFCLVMVVARGLVANGAQHIDLIANAVGVAVCFGTGLWLVPNFGAKGAAAAQLLSFTAIALIEVLCLARRLSGLKALRTAAVAGSFILIAQIFLWEF